MHVCAGRGESPRYVRFHDAIAGWGGVDFDLNHSQRQLSPTQCTAANIKPVRDLAYRYYGIPAVPAARLPKQRIVFLGRNETDYRQFLEPNKIVSAL